MKKIVIVGASSGIAEQCMRLWVVEKNVELILIGRNLQKLQTIIQDLQIRNPQAKLQAIEGNFLDPKAIESLINELAMQGKIDQVLIAHGILPVQDNCQQDLLICQETLSINAISPVLFAEAFIRHFEQYNHGNLAIIGSVAGDRGRKSNYSYGASKALIECYVQGLQHRLANSNIKIILVKPGPTDTPMTAHLKAQGLNLSNAKDVAKDIVRAMAQGKKVIYTPAKWRLIMGVIRNLPNFVFNRLDI